MMQPSCIMVLLKVILYNYTADNSCIGKFLVADVEITSDLSTAKLKFVKLFNALRFVQILYV